MFKSQHKADIYLLSESLRSAHITRLYSCNFDLSYRIECAGLKKAYPVTSGFISVKFLMAASAREQPTSSGA